ncbi:MAG: OmpA family protein [Clostridia bacterium]|nr:OmpA family protein [Clostridia bacterium]
MIKKGYRLSKKGKIVLFVFILLIIIAILSCVKALHKNSGNQKPSNIPASDNNASNNQGIEEENTKVPENKDNIVQIDEYNLSLYFSPGKSTLSIESISALDLFIDIYKEYPNCIIQIEGNCATMITKKLSEREKQINIEFARTRAEAVAKYLNQQGVSESDMHIKSNGSNKPLESNVTAAGRKINRRVDIFVEMKEQ